VGSSRILFLAPLAIFILVAAVAGYYLLENRDPRLLPSAMINKPAPTFRLNGLSVDGREVAKGFSSDDFKGHITVLNFFASWCGPCLVEHPQVMALAGMRGVVVLGVNYKNKPVDAAAWLARNGNPYARIGVDPQGDLALEFGLYAVPETFVIDHTGRIRVKHVGPITEDVLQENLLPAIRALQR